MPGLVIPMELTLQEFDQIQNEYYALKDPFPKKAKPEVISYEKLIDLANEYRKPQTKLLFVWLYLTGQRITEALELRRSNLTLATIKLKEFIAVDSISEKNRNRPRREILIPRFGYEKRMVDWVWKEIEPLEPIAKLFTYTRQMAFNYLGKVQFTTQFMDLRTKTRFTGSKGVNPHYLRHCRATHLREKYYYDTLQLLTFFGWVNANMASVYVRPTRETLAGGFIHD